MRFLTQTGLTKSAAKFQKETGVDADAAASLPTLEEVYSSWMATNGAKGKTNNELSVESEVLSKKEKKKRKGSPALSPKPSPKLLAAAAPVMEEAPAEEAPKKKKRTKSMDAVEEVAVEEAPKKKKRKKSMDETVAEDEAPPAAPPAEEEAAPEKKKKKNKDKADEPKPKGEVFRRVDDAAWRAKIEKMDPRLLDNTHTAKVKFGIAVDTGDSWADKASEDLLKVKGKDFRKEMMKKKKASWKGGGALDQGVNSIPFPDSDDE